MALPENDPDCADYQSCYIFDPCNNEGHIQPHSKRRKLARTHTLDDRVGRLRGTSLLLGNESSENIKTRYDLFTQAWTLVEKSIDCLSQEANTEIVEELTRFILNVDFDQIVAKTPAGLIAVGPTVSSYINLFQLVSKQLKLEQRAVLINIVASQATNLKSLLKLINRKATDQRPHDDNSDERLPNRQLHVSKLNYDLQILHDHVRLQNIERVIVSFQDGEAFEASLLDDVIQMINSWRDRIPFVLLFGISTSIELFQEKLSRNTIRYLDGARFDMIKIDTEAVFKKAVSPNNPGGIWLGPGVSRGIIQRHKESIQSVASLSGSLKYIFMAHFFANPLSVFLADWPDLVSLQSYHYEAIRNLESFRSLAKSLLDQKEHDTVRKLLDDDGFLHDHICQEIRKSKEAISNILRAVELVLLLQSCMIPSPTHYWSDLYIEAMSGDLQNFVSIANLIPSVQKLPSDSLQTLLGRLSGFPLSGLSTAARDLQKLISKQDQNAAPLRSEFCIDNGTLRTTIIAQKVELSKQSSSLSKQDVAYTSIVKRVAKMLEEYLESHLINPRDLFLHEVLVYDLSSPYRDVFMPNPRHAVERALSSPHDYLGCSCCNEAEQGLSATQPATAILYQLYLESGAIVNISDLWSAFHTVIGDENAEDERMDQEGSLALFSRALAELKHMGMIKNSRKKPDHLAKMLWKGL